MADTVDDVSEVSPQLFIEEEDLEARLSSATCRRIFDDNNDGEVDFNPLQQLRKDASSKMASVLRGLYPLPVPTPIDPEIVRLTLDIATWMAAQRHPEVVRKDWEKLKKASDQELDDLRKGKFRLTIDVMPDSPVTAGPKLIAQNPDDDPPTKFFVGGMGDF